MQDATPLPRAGLLGNHRYLGKTLAAVVELIPAPKPDYWHVTVLGPGRIATSAQPVTGGDLLVELASSGVLAGQQIRWRKAWHRPLDANPHLRLFGKVYAIGSDTRLIKIGTSVDVIDRLGNLRAMSPCKLELLSSFDGGLPVERLFHRQLKAHRHHGEWFNPHPKVIEALDRCRTAHGLYALVIEAVPWEQERGPEEWEKKKRTKGTPSSSGGWAWRRKAGLDGEPKEWA